MVASASMAQFDPSSCKFTEGLIDPTEIAPMVEAVAADGMGRSSEDQVLINKIEELGPKAIPQLLLLLEHKNEDVRSHAAHILKRIDGLTDEHLDKLILFMTEGNRNLSPAIARIGTPEAMNFLIDELKALTAKEQWESILIRAFASAEERAVPYLIELFGIQDVDPLLLDAVGEIFEGMGEGANSAIDPLCEIAQDGNFDTNVRAYAILALGDIGVTAQSSVPILKNIAETNPDFENCVVSALMNMRSPEAVGYLIRGLSASDSVNVVYDFRYIAKMGGDAIEAGPVLVQYLNHHDWEVRVAAARALGYIGYKEAEQPLIESLGNTNDWRLVYVAADSLGKLKAKDSFYVLTCLSQDHWYPPVRDMARDARRKINDSVDFFAYKRVKFDALNEVTIVSNECFVTHEGSLSHSKLANITYDAYDNVPNAKSHKQTPDVGIMLEDGYLVGSSRGEWGGELMFIDSAGNSSMVLKDTIVGIYHTPKGILAVAGVSAMLMKRGMIYKVSRDDIGNWRATKWKALPGGLKSSALIKDGSLYIECVGGNVVFTPEGTIKMALKIKGVTQE